MAKDMSDISEKCIIREGLLPSWSLTFNWKSLPTCGYNNPFWEFGLLLEQQCHSVQFEFQTFISNSPMYSCRN